MQVSWESDFELFAQKVKKHASSTIQKIEDKASTYNIESEENALQNLKHNSQKLQSQWEIELHEKEQEEYKNIDNEINKKWNDFKQDREKKLHEKLRQKLEDIFPTLAQSFILYVLDKYETGTLIMPKTYIKLVEIKKFNIQESEDECIIFKNSNLYIEYSIERIMEEIHNDITSSMNIEEKQWQV